MITVGQHLGDIKDSPNQLDSFSPEIPAAVSPLVGNSSPPNNSLSHVNDFPPPPLEKDSLTSPGGIKALPQPPALSPQQKAQERKKEFQLIIVKCVLHLLVIQTLNETINGNEMVYRSLSSKHLFLLMDCLERSWKFASKFNGDMNLRLALYKMGFMRQLPNLLKQETTSVSGYIIIMIRMYSDKEGDRPLMKGEVEQRFIP